MPLVLSECVGTLGAYVRGGRPKLQVLIGQTKQKIRKVISRPYPSRGRGSAEEEVTVNEEIEDGVVLIRRIGTAKFPVVGPLDPRYRIRPRKGVVNKVGRPLRAEAYTQALCKAEAGWAGRVVGSDRDSQLTGGGLLDGRHRLQPIVPLGRKPELVQQVWRERPCVRDVRKVPVLGTGDRITANIDRAERRNGRVPKGAEGDREPVLLIGNQIELKRQLVVIILPAPCRHNLAARRRGNQSTADVLRSDAVDPRRVYYSLCGEGGVWLKEGVALQVCGYTRVRASTNGVRKIAAQLRRRKGRRCAGLVLN